MLFFDSFINLFLYPHRIFPNQIWENLRRMYKSWQLYGKAQSVAQNKNWIYNQKHPALYAYLWNYLILIEIFYFCFIDGRLLLWFTLWRVQLLATTLLWDRVANNKGLYSIKEHFPPIKLFPARLWSNQRKRRRALKWMTFLCSSLLCIAMIGGRGDRKVSRKRLPSITL